MQRKWLVTAIQSNDIKNNRKRQVNNNSLLHSNLEIIIQYKLIEDESKLGNT